MVQLERRQQIALKEETTEGTAIAVASVDAAFNTFEVSFSPDIQQFERNPNRTTYGSLASLAGVKLGRVTFTTELVGSGNGASGATAIPPWSEVLKSCGYATAAGVFVESALAGISGGPFTAGEVVTGTTSSATGTVMKPNATGDDTLWIETITGTFGATETLTGGTSAATATGTNDSQFSPIYRPDSSTNKSYTVAVFQDGVKHIIKGARGNMRLTGAVGEPIQMQCEYIGALDSTADVALLSGVVYPASVPPQLLGVQLAFGAYAPIFENFSLDTGNSLNPRRNANDASGVISTRITGRTVTGSIDPEATSVADEDWFGKLSASTQTTMSLQAGSASGNAFKIVAPHTQYANISGASRNEILTNNVDLRCNEFNGDDDVAIIAVANTI